MNSICPRYGRMLVACLVLTSPVFASAIGCPAAAAGSAKPEPSKEDAREKLTPEQKMETRFPQPAKVGRLIGLPVLDEQDSTIGYVQKVIRTPEGKVRLIVPYGEWFGWAREGTWFARQRRPVAVPIEAVQILALQINAVEMDRAAFKSAPTWSSEQSTMLLPDDTIRIAVGRR